MKTPFLPYISGKCMHMSCVPEDSLHTQTPHGHAAGSNSFSAKTPSASNTGRGRRWILLTTLALSSLIQDNAHGAGATTPFTTLEAENGTRAGGATLRSFTLGSTVPTVATPELEASGGAFVALTQTGASVSWTNNVANANAIVIRNSIPDAANGGGITATINLYVNGVLRQAVTVSSKQSWVYRNATPNNDNPNGGGMPYKFYNEDRAFITGAAIPSGATIMLRKDAANSAAFYHIDCIDLENVPGPKPQPANSLSVISYGADPTFVNDSTTAFRNCINAARTQGKSVWIPAGKFMVNNTSNGGIDIAGVTVDGAGMWHSMIYKNIPLPPPTTPWRSNIRVGTNSVIRDVSIDSNAIYKAIGGASGDDYGISSEGSNWLIERVWVQHCDAQWLSGTDGIIRDSRVADSWADGINLNNGNTYNTAKLGLRLTAQNNFVRGAGDDSIATYSDAGASGTNSQMDGTKILNNTTVAPWWANGMRIAGGKNVLVQNNLITDPAANNGMDIGIFGSTGQPLESATVTGNVILRGGGWNTTNRHGVSLGFPSTVPNTIVFSQNFIGDSRRNGINVNTRLTNLTMEGNLIYNPAAVGVQITSGSTGSATLRNNAVTDLNTGQTAYANAGTMTMNLSGNSWQTVAPLPNGTYKALARHSGLALDVINSGTANGSQLQQWGYSGANNQRWTLTQLGGNAYRITGVGSGRVLDSTWSLANGTRIHLWDWRNQTNQVWLITPTNGGYYSVVAVHSGKAMEVAGGSGATAAGAAVQLWTLGAETNKQWSFTAP